MGHSEHLKEERSKMSKLSFRARALDANKPMPILRAQEIPDLPDFAAINRAVPMMPTGMEKEEERDELLNETIAEIKEKIDSLPK